MTALGAGMLKKGGHGDAYPHKATGFVHAVRVWRLFAKKRQRLDENVGDLFLWRRLWAEPRRRRA